MVLDDVPGGADAVVVAGPAADADVLGHGDLHVVDVGPVPDRLVHLVGEAQRQDVLDRLLAQVVVDAEDLVRLEHVVHQRVQLLGARQIVPERLFDDGAAPGALGGVRETVLLELLDHLGEELRRHREVEGVVAAGAPGGVQLVHGLAQLLEGVVVVEVARDEPHPLGELLPDLLAELGAGVLLDGLVDHLGEVLVLPVPAGEAHQGEARRQQAPVGQVVHGRHQLLTGQVAGDAEDDQTGGARDPGQPAVLRVAQRIAPVGRRGRRRGPGRGLVPVPFAFPVLGLGPGRVPVRGPGLGPGCLRGHGTCGLLGVPGLLGLLRGLVLARVRVGKLLAHSPSTPLLIRDFVTASSSSCQAASNLATPSRSNCSTTSS
ncbi:hypothetical protein SFUMM280S_04815 [Streptomyces fumanus]